MAPLGQTSLNAIPSDYSRASDQNPEVQHLIVPIHVNTAQGAPRITSSNRALADLKSHLDAHDLLGDKYIEPRSLLHDTTSQLDMGLESDQRTIDSFPRSPELQFALNPTNSAEEWIRSIEHESSELYVQQPWGLYSVLIALLVWAIWNVLMYLSLVSLKVSFHQCSQALPSSSHSNDNETEGDRAGSISKKPCLQPAEANLGMKLANSERYERVEVNQRMK